jgi:UDP-N-acetyl-D-glucosamine dehydrogenase
MNDTATGTVGVVGLGYVGLPLSLAMTSAGYDVVGVDIDDDRVELLQTGTSYVSDVSDSILSRGITTGFRPTTEYDALADVEAVSICVPTPMRKSGTPNLSYVASAVEELLGILSEGCTVILESTVYPGATEELIAEALTDNGFTVGEDIFVAFSPERIDPGNEQYGPADMPKVLGGVTTACGDRATALYEPVFDQVVRVDSATEAELVKLLENTFRAVNIGLINELAQIAHSLDVDIWNVIDAAATKPFGYMPFYPGPGLGGHCIPVDPMFLSWQANQQGIETRFIDLADQVNREMPNHVVHRLIKELNDRGIALSNAEILVLGVAYKADVSDTRESPAIDIIDRLLEWGASVRYHDPYVPELHLPEKKYESIDLTVDRLSSADCSLILTDHTELSIDRVIRHSSLVFDTRNATSASKSENIVRL